MASMSTVRRKLKNNHYENVVKQLVQINLDVYRFVNEYGQVCYYSNVIDAVFESLPFLRKEYRRMGIILIDEKKLDQELVIQ